MYANNSLFLEIIYLYIYILISHNINMIIVLIVFGFMHQNLMSDYFILMMFKN